MTTFPAPRSRGIYFDYVRRRDARALARVFRHNRTDIVSLAALALRWPASGSRAGEAEDPRDVFSLARVLERAKLYERCEAAYHRTLANDRGALRVAALVRLASRAKRSGDHGRRPTVGGSRRGGGSAGASRARPHHEQRSRDLPAALEAVDRGLALCARLGRVSAGLRLGLQPDRREPAACEGSRYFSSALRNSTSSWITTGLLKTVRPARLAASISGERA